MVKTSNAGGMCSIPGQRTKMSHTKAWPKKKKKKKGKSKHAICACKGNR